MKGASAHQATIQDPIKSQAQNELQAKIDALMNSVSTKHQDRFPKPPTEADEDAWANWEGKCVNVRRNKAAKQKERIVQGQKEYQMPSSIKITWPNRKTTDQES